MGVIAELLARIADIAAEKDSEEQSQSILGKEPLSINRRANSDAEKRLAEQDTGLEGAVGKNSEEERRKHAAETAAVINVKMMREHEHFAMHGFSSTEELYRFGEMLEDDRYWGYLQENDRERAAVATQQAVAVSEMEPQEREEYFEARPRARELDAEWRLAMAEYMENPDRAKEKYGADYFRGIDDVMGPNFMEDQRKLPPEQRHDVFQERVDENQRAEARAEAAHTHEVRDHEVAVVRDDAIASIVAKSESAQQGQGDTENHVAQNKDVVENIDFAAMLSPEVQQQVAQQNVKLQEDSRDPGDNTQAPTMDIAASQEPAKEAGREMG